MLSFLLRSSSSRVTVRRHRGLLLHLHELLGDHFATSTGAHVGVNGVEITVVFHMLLMVLDIIARVCMVVTVGGVAEHRGTVDLDGRVLLFGTVRVAG